MAISPFSGKIAFVTGAASKRGMGHAVALRLAAEGVDVAILDKYRAPKSLFAEDEGWRGLDEGVEEIKAMGRQAFALTADDSDRDEAKEAVEKVLKKFGRIDILSIVPRSADGQHPGGGATEEDWRKVVDVNLTGTFIISKQVAQHMIKRGGPGRWCSSRRLRKDGVAGTAPYVASKWGILGFTQSLALELARYRINVNSVCPGHIQTNIQDQWFEEQAKMEGISVDEFRKNWYAEMAKTVPLGRYGTAEDVADVVMFLVSKQADYMTGQAINVSGGKHMS
jgi:NAD(P)-dependent dehydrogenase (short-subunit alcohol dehydrogenase family)